MNCPSCGYCQHCGRGGYPTFPQPYTVPDNPWFRQWWETTTGDKITFTTQPNTNGSITFTAGGTKGK